MLSKRNLGATLATLGIAAVGLSLAPAARAGVTLIDNYNFSGYTTGATTVKDTAGNANLTVGSAVTFSGGAANTPLKAYSLNDYLSYQGQNLTNITNNLAATSGGSTYEFFVTGAAIPQYNTALFALGNGSGGATTGKYMILSGERAQGNGGSGAGISIKGGYTNETGAVAQGAYAGVVAGKSAPTDVTEVFSGSGATGTFQVYFNGVAQLANPVAFANTPDLLAKALLAGGGATIGGIGGGSVYGGDFTFGGGFSDVRIYSGALTATQALADYAAGPNVTLISAAPEPSEIGMLAIIGLGLGAMLLRARRRNSISVS